MSSTTTLNPAAKRAAALLIALGQCRLDIEDLLASLVSDDLARPTVCIGWSVRDQIGHIIEATEMLSKGLEEAAVGSTEGVLRPQEMAKAMQASAIERVALLPVSRLMAEYHRAAERLLDLLESRDPQAWEEDVPHPYLGTCQAVQFAGFALLDWMIHPWDIRTALEQTPRIRADHAALLVPGLINLLPKRLDASRARGLRGRFRYQIEQENDPATLITSLDVVLVKNVATIEKEVAETIPADLTFKGRAGDLALAMLGRKGISKVVLPGPGNEYWLPRWGWLWISL